MPEPADASAQQGTTDQQSGDSSAAQTGTQQTGDATGSSGTNGGAERRYTQGEVDAVVKERLERERRKADEKAQQDREEAERKRAEEQGEWQKVAQQHEAKVKEFEPYKAKAERYEAALTTLLEQERTGLPDHVIELLDGREPDEQLAYIAKHRDQLRPTDTAASHGTNGVPATPYRANGQAVATAQTQDRQQQFDRTARSIWGKG